MNYTNDVLKQLPIPLTEFLEHYLTEASDSVKVQVEDYVQDLLEHVTNLEEELKLMEEFADEMEDNQARMFWAVEEAHEKHPESVEVKGLMEKFDKISSCLEE